MKITIATRIENAPSSGPVFRAVKALKRDILCTCCPDIPEGVSIRLVQQSMEEERYFIHMDQDNLLLEAGDDLGFVYGLYHISHELLGVEPFWFWNDQPHQMKDGWEIPDGYEVRSPTYAVRYRGWFINDEVLLHTWKLDGSKDKPWEMVFEALLRLGGNMVIPGTDKNAHRYRALAADHGLYITHHHAEPLGATMFLRAYPELTPSYAEHPELFRKLWQEAIDEQKDQHTVWNIGFRGQGDKPFWADDPRYDTPESRGQLMSQLIREQYDLIRNQLPGAVCCTNLYGETMELYQKGFLKLPDDVICIWADNGYGKMVTRRQGNHNPRIRALPVPGQAGRHGLYYHASFYDLQAASHMTMLPNPPSFVRRELMEALSLGVKDYWIVNCSNVKPHVYTLDYIAALWRNGDADPETHLQDYCRRYYGIDNAASVETCFRMYYDNVLAYGEREDERAGEQFANHCARILVSQWIKNKSEPAPEMEWAVQETTLKKQVLWYREKCAKGAAQYAELDKACSRASLEMTCSGAKLLRDTLGMQAALLHCTYQGSLLAMDSLLYAMEQDWLQAFFMAGKAKKWYMKADRAMRDREHGHWHLFYQNDCQADVKQSAWLMGVLMGVLRVHGDGPHFYAWQRRFLDPPEDAGIMLILNMENHLNNEELFEAMESRMEEKNGMEDVQCTIRIR